MGNVDHVHAALTQQGITDAQTAIAIVSMDWTYNHQNEQVDSDYSVTNNGAIMPTAPGVTVCACGGAALKLYQSNGTVPKNIGIEKTRGAYRPYGMVNSWLTGAYDPNTAYPDHVAGFRADAMVAHRVAVTGETKAILPVRVEVARSVFALLQSLEDEPTLGGMSISADTETMGLDPYKKGAKIICISLTWKRDAWTHPRCTVIYTLNMKKMEWALLSDGLNELFNHRLVKMVGANLKYDWGWFGQQGVTGSRFVFDTMLGGSLVDENRWNSLNQHAKTYTGFGGYDDAFNLQFDKAHMEDVPEGDVIEYAGGDSLACHYSARSILTELKDMSKNVEGKILKRSPYNFYDKVLHPAARAFETVEQRGMYIDKKEFDKFGKWAEKEATRTKVQLSAQLPQSVKSKFEDWDTFKPTVVVEYLFEVLGLEPKMYTGKSGKISTAWSHLQSFADDPIVGEWVKTLKEHNALKKMHSTYYEGFLKHLCDDGLFHPTYWLHRAGMGDEGGAVTGRSSVTNPPVQTIPKHTEVAKRLRKCFIAPPGYYVAGLDYSQGELRIVACVANETTMLKVYEKGGDLHAVTASNMLGIPLEEFLKFKETDEVYFEAKRRNGKAGNFGLVYGMGAEGYVEYAWNQYGVLLDYVDAVAQRDTFFETYPELNTYHRTQTGEVNRKGMVISPLGRIRHLPHIWCDDQYSSGKARRQAINAPIQSTLSDMSFWSIARLHQHFPEIWVWGMIHDQNLLYVRKDRWQEEIEQAKQVMENLPFEETFDWSPELKFPVDALVGPNLGELYDVGKFDG